MNTIVHAKGDPTPPTPPRRLAATQSSARTRGKAADAWCTPEIVLDRVRFVGPIGLDPCTSAENPVEAPRFFVGGKQNGLKEPWAYPADPSYAMVFANFPYSQAALWANKIVAEAAKGVEIVSLCAARPDSRWFFHLVWDNADAVCFWKGRLKFVGAPSSAPFPSAIAYHGPRPWRFEEAFADAGKVVRLR